MQYIKHILNRWQFGIWFRKNYYCSEYSKEFCVYFLKFVRFPDEGYVIEKEHYKGFLFRKEIKLPNIILKRFKIGKFYITIPIKITFKD